MSIHEDGQTKYNWNGYSSDMKPMSGVPEGSTFHVVDTGEQFFFHDGMWFRDLRMSYAMSNVTLIQA